MIGIALVLAVCIAGASAAAAGVGTSKDTDPATPFAGSTASIDRGDLSGQVNVSGVLLHPASTPVRATSSGTLTSLPATAEVLKLGSVAYTVDNAPVFVLFGTSPAWRSLEGGAEDGPDVQQLEESLRSLGVFDREPDQHFTSATSAAIKRWQSQTGQEKTGSLSRGSFLFLPGEVRVGEASAQVGATVSPGAPVYDTTSTAKAVTADVALADQQLAVRGSRVQITLPGAKRTTGTITDVGLPAEKTAANGQNTTVIPITVALDSPADADGFQQASVTLALASSTAKDVLSVPVGALLALTETQFAVQVVDPDGTVRDLPVSTEIFAGGRVEVSGTGVSEGLRVVIPGR